MFESSGSRICCLVIVVLAACAPKSGQKVTVSQTVGSNGGTVTNGGASVSLPSGAVSGNVTITNTQDPSAPPPSNGTVLGTPYTFGPEGQQFSVPVTVTLPFDPTKIPAGASPSDVVVVTAPAGSTDFTSIGGRLVDATHVAAMTTHFSTFVPIIIPHDAGSSASTDAGGGGPTRDGGTVVGGSDGGTVVGGSDGGTVVGGSDGGTVVGGSDGGTVVGGSDGGTVVGGSDGGSVGGSETCDQVLNCIGGCGLNAQCQATCLSGGTAQAQSLASAVINCVEPLCPGTDGGVCETASQACSTCESTSSQDSCGTQYGACIAASDGGIPSRDGGSAPSSDAGSAGCGPVSAAGGGSSCQWQETCGSTTYMMSCTDSQACTCYENSNKVGSAIAGDTVCSSSNLPTQWTQCGFPGGPAASTDAGSAPQSDAGPTCTGSGSGGPNGTCSWSETCGSTSYSISCSNMDASCVCESSTPPETVAASSTVCNSGSGYPPAWTECGYPGGPSLADAGSSGGSVDAGSSGGSVDAGSSGGSVDAGSSGGSVDAGSAACGCPFPLVCMGSNVSQCFPPPMCPSSDAGCGGNETCATGSSGNFCVGDVDAGTPVCSNAIDCPVTSNLCISGVCVKSSGCSAGPFCTVFPCSADSSSATCTSGLCYGLPESETACVPGGSDAGG